jgi:hypothetical protein
MLSVLSVAHATHESKKLSKDPKMCGVVKFALQRNSPAKSHNGISLFHGLSRAAFDELGLFG